MRDGTPKMDSLLRTLWLLSAQVSRIWLQCFMKELRIGIRVVTNSIKILLDLIQYWQSI